MTASARRGSLDFDTALGTCRLDWDGSALTGVRLVAGPPRPSRSKPPAFVRDARECIDRLLRGEAADLTGIPLDLEELPPFHRAVYRAARGIPPGARLSYGALADRAGAPGAARAVGQAMRRNPFLFVVPCHRVVAADGRLGGFSARGGQRTKRRLLAIERRGAEERDRAREARWPFDLSVARRHLRRRDPVLGLVIAELGAVRFERQTSPTPYRALFRAIVYQQLSGKAASTILGRVLALFAPKPFPAPADVVAMPEETLRGAGLSRAKTAAVKDLSSRVLDGTVPGLKRLRGMDDETVIDHLVQVRGVGRWTAEMFLISQLGRPDVLPVDDLGVRRGFGVVFGDGSVAPAETLIERAEAWRPYRTVASWYLWQAADTLLL